ncbi:hypothetical protein JXJ21_05080 [candidate division KSB1 bacterium]|nr:hypothetical protein [candidate division KSB1 bacterium]
MKSLIFILLSVGCAILVVFACDSNSGSQATGDATGFNPKAWYGKTRAEIGQLHPEISRIKEEMSSGPFNLPGAYGVEMVNFTFEDSWQDGLLRSVNLTWREGISVEDAAKKFGIDITDITPGETPAYWEYAINADGINVFRVKFSKKNSEETPVKAAWIVYQN